MMPSYRRDLLLPLLAKLLIAAGILAMPLGAVVAQLSAPRQPMGGATTTLLAGAFASGTGGSAMTSANYQVLAAVGEAALPNNQTTLASANFQHQPGFLAAMPSSPPILIGSLYLPALVRDDFHYFAGPDEVEPNNTFQQANGPLLSGTDYHGYQNDLNDYFGVYLPNGGRLVVDLTNTSLPDTQLQLYYQSTSNRVGQAGGAPYHLEHSGAAGSYFIRVVTGTGSNTVNPYTLRVTYP